VCCGIEVGGYFMVEVGGDVVFDVGFD